MKTFQQVLALLIKEGSIDVQSLSIAEQSKIAPILEDLGRHGIVKNHGSAEDVYPWCSVLTDYGRRLINQLQG